MTTPTQPQSISELREDFKNYPDVDTMGVAAAEILDRLEAAEAAQKPRLIDEAPQDGSEVLAWVPHLGWAALSWSHVSDCWVGHGREYPTHWVYLPSPVDDTYSRGATP